MACIRDIRALKRVLEGPLPVVEVGDHCHEPHECPFMGRCWPKPPALAIETLYRMRRDQREACARAGYRTLLDLPDDADLTAIQDRQRRAARRNGLVVEKGIGKVLGGWEPPFAYLDFETVAPAIPVWEGCRPYNQVPAQLSVHRETGGTLQA